MTINDWQARHADRLATPAEAVALLAPGTRILIGSGAAEPLRLVDALVRDAPQLRDNEVVHLLTLGPAPYVAPSERGRFRHIAFFIGPNVRDAVARGDADFMPVFLSELPGLIRSRRIRIDAALVQVGPPDRHGYCSLGVSVDIVRAAVDSAALLLAEVNPRMPRTFGDSFVPAARFARLVPVDEELLEARPEPPDEVARRIGAHVATLVPDGATLQVGIGTIPDAVLAALHGHRDLGLHSEMLSDGVMRLCEAGVMTGRKKTSLPGKLVTSFIMGTRALYRWADDNPAIEMRGSDYTNDPAIIARHDSMVAINGALAVDLTGQVASDTLRGRFFSGIGGQVDFIRGAARSRNGRPIIALPSLSRDGRHSRISASFEAGAGVVTSRGDVHYVVTEYGVADLWGKSVRERALALLEVAHPDARGDLLAAAKARRYVFLDQHPPRASGAAEAEESARLPNGLRILLRPLRLSDERPLQELLYGLSDESVYHRFLGVRGGHPHEEVQRMVDLGDETSLGVVAVDAETGALLGMARGDLDRATSLYDLGFVVAQDKQNQGVGTALMGRIRRLAEAQGAKGFQADVLAHNRRMLAVLNASGMKVASQLSGGVYHLELRF